MIMIKIEINTQTNEITEIPFTKAEIEQAKLERQLIDAEIEAFVIEEKEKKQKKEDILNRLGITEDEAKLLLS